MAKSTTKKPAKKTPAKKSSAPRTAAQLHEAARLARRAGKVAESEVLLESARVAERNEAMA